MKNVIFLILGAALFASCEGEGGLNVNFKSVFQDEPLELNRAYALGDIDVKFENIAFFITDLALVDGDGKEMELADVEFLEMNSDAETGKTLSYKGIPEGSYKSLKFNIGVTEDLNATSPGDYNITDALGRSDHYWEAWKSYIFSKTEGSADVSGDGVFDLKWFYHTGSDALLRSLEIKREINIEKDSDFSLELTMDYNRLLRYDDGTPFDIESKPRNHNPDDTALITQFVDNYDDALSVKVK